MRTLFDQYRHPENRLTHALVCCLAEDPAFLAAFLRSLDIAPPRGERLHLVEQRLPGEAETREELSESAERRLPDAWIYTDSGWALLIESKIASPIDAAQLRGHLAIAERRGFSDVRLLVLSPNAPTRTLPERCDHRRWRDLYRIACGEAHRSVWAAHLIRYMPVAEQRMVDDAYLQEGTLTTFAGIPFSTDYPYSYLEAKRLLRLLMAELRGDPSLDAMGVNRAEGGRTAITGSAQESVWDYLPLAGADPADAFNKGPHLTVAIRRDRVIAQLTLPHGLNTVLRRRLRDLGYADFKAAVATLVAEASPLFAADPGVVPFLLVQQRRYSSQRSTPIVDALLEIDPRTALADHGGIKLQEQWLRTAFEVYANRQSNIQMGIGLSFRYGKSTQVGTPEFIQSVSGTWRSTRPILQALGLLPDAPAASPSRPRRAGTATRIAFTN